MLQHVVGTTHLAGDTMDVVITQDTTIIKVGVDPPVYFDHSLVTTEITIDNGCDNATESAVTVTKRYWTSLDVEAFRNDLLVSLMSEIITNPPGNCDELFSSCGPLSTRHSWQQARNQNFVGEGEALWPEVDLAIIVVINQS